MSFRKYCHQRFCNAQFIRIGYSTYVFMMVRFYFNFTLPKLQVRVRCFPKDAHNFSFNLFELSFLQIVLYKVIVQADNGRKNSSESSCYAYIYCYFYVFTELYKSLNKGDW